MPEIVRNPEVIKEWVKNKQRNEQKMLNELNKLFKERLPTLKMRNLVLAGFEQMCREAALIATAGPALGAIRDEKNLAVWQTLERPTGVPGMRLVRMTNKLIAGDAAPHPPDCNDLSELIRVVGAWLEKGGGFGVSDINKAYRVGAGEIEAPEGPSADYLEYLGELRRRHGWQYADSLTSEERATLDKLATTGDFIERQNARDAKNWGRDVRSREDPNQQHAIEEHVAQYWVRPKFGKQSGMQLFRVNRDDICKKIGLLFGFLKGATISGTTTDTVLVLEGLGGLKNLHTGYYLFPVATIAASLHHTCLEAGLALTVADVIDSYCAGYYTSLLPKGGLPAELERAQEILREGETNPDNRHLLLWYEGNEEFPAGCIHWNKPFEVQDARRLAEAKGLLTHVMHMPQVPDKMAISRFLQLMAPRLLAYLPEEFHLR